MGGTCRGRPTEWTARTNCPPAAVMASNTEGVTRVMTCIESMTYEESVSCTPYLASGEPSGPIEKGSTYMTRPAIAPGKRSAHSAASCSRLIHCESCPRTPAATCGTVAYRSRVEIHVLLSTRATSFGSVWHTKLHTQ